MSLDHAPDHVKLAVDLIELLESHEIEPNVAVDALNIVLKDYQIKLEKKLSTSEKFVVVDEFHPK